MSYFTVGETICPISPSVRPFQNGSMGLNFMMEKQHKGKREIKYGAGIEFFQS